MTKGKATSVKGFTYEFSSSGNPTVFSAEVKENANVWFRHYNNPAAFDASEQEFGSAASFAGSDTPTVTPNHAGSDTQTGEMFSVAQVPDGSLITTINSGVAGADFRGLTWTGQYFAVADRGHGLIYVLDESGNQVNSFSSPAPDPVGITWDGEYYWHTDRSSGFIYQLKSDGAGTQTNNGFGSGGVVADIRDISWNGSYLFVGAANKDFVYRYDVSGTRYQFTINHELPGITWDGKYFWLTGPFNSGIYQYDEGFNEVAAFNDGASSDEGMAWDGSYLYGTDNSSNIVYRYSGSNSLDISYRFHEVT